MIQIEQQAYGPNGDNYVPVEWDPAVYDAIKALTGKGRVVVEPAGNGNENLDDTSVYGSTFPMGKPDSGAIIVGAGSNCDATARQSRLYSSDYGKRVNLQGPGECVATTGYGDLENYSGTANSYYTRYFGGTSSAPPVIAAAAADLSSAYQYLNGGAVPTPTQIRSTLAQNATPQNFTSSGAPSGHIGPYPNLAKALLTTDKKPPTVPPTWRSR